MMMQHSEKYRSRRGTIQSDGIRLVGFLSSGPSFKIPEHLHSPSKEQGLYPQESLFV